MVSCMYYWNLSIIDVLWNFFSLVHNPATFLTTDKLSLRFSEKFPKKFQSFFQYDRYFKSETKNSKTNMHRELFKTNHLQAITFVFRFLAALFGSVALT